MSDADKRRKALEEQVAARKHVERHGAIGFSYRPTPPSGPSPETTKSSLGRPKRKR